MLRYKKLLAEQNTDWYVEEFRQINASISISAKVVTSQDGSYAVQQTELTLSGLEDVADDQMYFYEVMHIVKNCDTAYRSFQYLRCSVPRNSLQASMVSGLGRTEVSQEQGWNRFSNNTETDSRLFKKIYDSRLFKKLRLPTLKMVFRTATHQKQTSTPSS